jgi:hypothetical protein
MIKENWPAFLLILVGATLLLNSFDIIDFVAGDLFTYGFIILGVIFLVNGYSREDKKGIFGGTFFFTYGVVLTLMRTGAIYRDDDLGFGWFFLALAAANLVNYLFKTERTSNLVWGFIFGILGGSFILSYYGYLSRWFCFEQIDHYWPLILVILGISLILKGIRHRTGGAVNSA